MNFMGFAYLAIWISQSRQRFAGDRVMTTARRFFLLFVFSYLGILAVALVELKRAGESAQLHQLLNWPLVPLYYMALFGLPFLIGYGFLARSNKLVIHIGLAVLIIPYAFVFLSLLSGEVSGNPARLALKYGGIASAAVLFAYFCDQIFARYRNRVAQKSQLSAFD
jgi:hypothetical protein